MNTHKKSINAMDFIRTSRRIYNSINDTRNARTLEIPQDIHKSPENSKNHHDFLEKIRKTRKLRRGICLPQHSSLTKQENQEEIDANLMISSRRENPSPTKDQQMQNTSCDKSTNLDEHSPQKNKTSYLNRFRKEKMAKNFVQSQIREFQMNLKQKNQLIGENAPEIQTIDMEAQQKMSPFQLNVHRKKMNRAKLKMNSLESVLNVSKRYESMEVEDISKKRNHFVIMNNKIVKIYKNTPEKQSSAINNSPLSKSITLVPLSQSQKRNLIPKKRLSLNLKTGQNLRRKQQI